MQNPLQNQQTKTCTQCGQNKPRTEEYYHRQGAGYRSSCKMCSNAVRRVGEAPDGRVGQHTNLMKLESMVRKLSNEFDEKVTTLQDRCNLLENKNTELQSQVEVLKKDYEIQNRSISILIDKVQSLSIRHGIQNAQQHPVESEYPPPNRRNLIVTDSDPQPNRHSPLATRTAHN